MAGFDLMEGTYEARDTSDDELWSAFACLFSSKSKNTSSYKYGFLKAIIENLYNVDADLKLSFVIFTISIYIRPHFPLIFHLPISYRFILDCQGEIYT